jgi:hypothetical protein
MAYLLAFNRHAFPDGSALATLTGKYTLPPGHARTQQVQLASSALPLFLSLILSQLLDVIAACLVLKPSDRPSSKEVLRCVPCCFYCLHVFHIVCLEIRRILQRPAPFGTFV